jgi:hypothetical protein
MGKKYLETKEKSLESSILGIWQEAAKKEDELAEAKFSPKEIKMAIGVASDKRYAGGNMTGAVKAIEKMKKGLSDHPQVKAVLRRQNENIEEAQSGGKEEYQKFFNAALKKFKVKSPAEFKSDEEKKKFYDYIDKNWEGDNEKAEGAMSQVREFKIAGMKAALADIWGMKEGKNPFKKEEEEKPVITKGGKTLTGKKPANIDINPKVNKEA